MSSHAATGDSLAVEVEERRLDQRDPGGRRVVSLGLGFVRWHAVRPHPLVQVEVARAAFDLGDAAEGVGVDAEQLAERVDRIALV